MLKSLQTLKLSKEGVKETTVLSLKHLMLKTWVNLMFFTQYTSIL